jgi:peptidoglycan/LPS O-acetylase OafA/YrhL
MLAIGTAAGAASFTHVHNVAASHGQPGWLAWADAIVLELMSIASGLELRRRRREHTSPRFPAVVLGCAVVLSLAAQVAEAEPSPIGWTAAAIPALGFLVMVKVALSHTGGPSARWVAIKR